MTYYEAGHMMYVHRPSGEKLVSDGRAFYREALAAGSRQGVPRHDLMQHIRVFTAPGSGGTRVAAR